MSEPSVRRGGPKGESNSAKGGTRTHTAFRLPAPKTGASANSATLARINRSSVARLGVGYGLRRTCSAAIRGAFSRCAAQRITKFWNAGSGSRSAHLSGALMIRRNIGSRRDDRRSRACSPQSTHSDNAARSSLSGPRCAAGFAADEVQVLRHFVAEKCMALEHCGQGSCRSKSAWFRLR